MLSHEQLFALGVLWVGGWGFLCFTYPDALCRILRRDATPKRVRLIRLQGAIGLIIVFWSAVFEFVSGFFSK